MDSIDDLMRDLEQADRLGDEELANAIAGRIRKLESPQEPQSESLPPAGLQHRVFNQALERVKDFSEGLGVSGLKTYYGVKDLAGFGKPEDRETLRAWQDAAGESFLGGSGELTGDLLQMAAPGGAAGKIGRGGAALKNTLAARNTMAADVASTAGLGYTQLPGENQTRGGNAAAYGAGAAAGYGAGKVLGTAVTGLRGTPASERLRDMGARLTPGQLKEGFTRGIENYLSYLVPSVSKGIQKAQGIADDSIRLALYKKAAPPSPQGIASGRFTRAEMPANLAPEERMAWLSNAYREAYDAAWPTLNEMAPRTVGRAAYRALRAMPKLKKSERRKLGTVLEDLANKVSENPNLSASDLDRVLRDSFVSPSKTNYKDFNALLNNMRQDLKAGLPQKNQEALKLIDRGYGKRMALSGASDRQKAGLARQAFDRKDLYSGMKKASDKSARERRAGHFQREAEDWEEIIGKPPGMLMTMTRRVVQMAPDLSRGGQQKLMDLVAGNYERQAIAREAMKNPAVQGLTRAMSGGKLGASAMDQLMEDEEY